jgi:superoxide dismutase, Fe-Mn family
MFPFVLPPLPYHTDALAPLISTETIEYHYGKHHKGYIDKLNELIKGTEYEGKSLNEIIVKSKQGPLYNNAAQVFNHTFYWNCMAPKSGGTPTGAIAQLIDTTFGSFQKFQEQFTAAAVGLFGSGWVWLVKNEQEKLEIKQLSNADCPLSHNMKPLLTCDVWEHSYYIDYRNARKTYVESWWKLVNWNYVNSLLG